MKKMLTALLLTVLVFTGSALAQDGRPSDLLDVALEQRLDQDLPLQLPFVDENGRDVALGDYFGERPVMLALVYYECPMLCTLVLNGVTTSLSLLEFNPGDEFEVVVVTIDPEESPELAAAKKRNVLEEYGRPQTSAGWHFLTGSEASIQTLANAIGFRYVFDEESGEYAHAAGIMVATPAGKLARYFYGIDYPPRDVRFALMEAAENRIGSLANQMLLFCYKYNPETGTYGAATFFLLRVGAGLTILGLVTGILLMRRRERLLARSAA